MWGEALDDTLDLVGKIYRANPKANIFLFYFTPLPGVRLSNSPQTHEMTLDVPQDLTQWSTHGASGFYSNYGVRQFLSPEYRKKVDRAKGLMFLMYRERVSNKNFLTTILKRIVLFRLQHELLGFRVVENRIWRYARLDN